MNEVCWVIGCYTTAMWIVDENGNGYCSLHIDGCADDLKEKACLSFLVLKKEK